MNIWVKEVPEIFGIENISMWLKKDVLLKPFIGFTDVVKIGDIVIVSKKDSDFSYNNGSLVTVIVYEEMLEKIFENILLEYQRNYDYYYLRNALEHAKNEEINTIITGSSYGLFGISSDMLRKEVNLSLTSQDLYYSLKCIYEVWKYNKNIKNIVLCSSYYYFYSDLSRTENKGEILRVSKVYNLLFGDMHNCILLPETESVLYKSEVFDIPKIMELYSMGDYKKSYFTENRLRRFYATRLWDEKTKDWADLDENEKIIAGKKRANLHNKNLGRLVSLDENIRLFNEFTLFCKQNSINLIVVVTPATKYYRNYFNDAFKDVFYNILDEAEGEIHLLDMFEDPFFEDADFNDMDHLSELGADKMTSLILDVLNEISV